MQAKISLSGAICLGLMVADAHAQVTIDVSKITCEQFRSYSITDPNNIALWLSGYYNGKRDNTIISIESFKNNLEKMKDYCITHRTTLVMQAAEVIFSDRK
jgi:acid stress chaperone HdeB